MSHLHGVLDEPLALLHGEPDVLQPRVHRLGHAAQDQHRRVPLGLLPEKKEVKLLVRLGPILSLLKAFQFLLT